ncbi:acyl-CoA reductase-like NAD-dependent aldehyde dehydrogenase [Bradyrhizobium sp. USDA 4369]
MTYQSVNPATGKLLRTFDELTGMQLEAKLATAETCFKAWKQKTYAERAEIVANAAALMLKRRDELAHIMTLEMGKRASEARGEVEFSATILTYYARNAARFLADVELHPTQGEGHMESTPIGAIFCVQPWNFPYYQLARVAGPQLMAGNVLLVKHAGCVPQCAMGFEKLWADAGAPSGLYTNLMISHEKSEGLIADPRIKGVALTGSVAAGRRIAASAGQSLKPSSMELGGSDAFIVLDDADLEHAVKWAVWGRTYNAGQTCADSDRCRPGFRDDLAHHSDLKSPTRSEMMSPTIPG